MVFSVIVDLNDRNGCQTASFTIGTDTMPTRSWDILVTQYACGSEDVAGPPGCLQYFTGVKGNIMSYNFPTADVTATSMSNCQNSITPFHTNLI